MGQLSRPGSRARWPAGTRSRILGAADLVAQRAAQEFQRSLGGLLRRHQRTDDPKQGDEYSDDEHHPVTLPDRHDPEGDEQDEVQDAANDDFDDALRSRGRRSKPTLYRTTLATDASPATGTIGRAGSCSRAGPLPVRR